MDYQNDHVALALEIEEPKDPDISLPEIEIAIREPGCWAAVFSVLAVLAVLFSVDELVLCDAKFSIQSIAVSSSSYVESLWTVDFLVKKPGFRCSICYDRDYVSANLGLLKSALLNVSHNHRSDGHMDFSVAFTAEAEVTTRNFTLVSGVHDLNIKLLVKREQFTSNNKPGHFSVHCPNLTVVYAAEMKSGAMLGDKKIECHSSFLELKELFPD